MKTGKSLQQLAQELARQRAAKRDFIAPTGSMAMTKKADQFHLFS